MAAAVAVTLAALNELLKLLLMDIYNLLLSNSSLFVWLVGLTPCLPSLLRTFNHLVPLTLGLRHPSFKKSSPKSFLKINLR